MSYSSSNLTMDPDASTSAKNDAASTIAPSDAVTTTAQPTINQISPTQIAAEYQEMEDVIKSSIEDTQCGDAAPIPPVQIADAYTRMENTIKSSIEDTEGDDAVPIPPAQVAAFYEDMSDFMEKAVKRSPPLMPPVSTAAQMASIAEVEDSDAIKNLTKKEDTFVTNEEIDAINESHNGVVTLKPSASSPDQEPNNNSLDMNQPSTSEPVATSPPQTTIMSSSPQSPAPMIIRPPPPSMVASAHRLSSLVRLRRDPSLPVIEARLVEDEPQLPIYDAVPLQENDQSYSLWKKRALVMASVIVALVVALGVFIGVQESNNGDKNSEYGSIDLMGESSDKPSTPQDDLSSNVSPSGSPSTTTFLDDLPKQTEVRACQCRKNGECYPDVLTRFKNEARICFVATRPILGFELLLFRATNSEHRVVEDGEILDGEIEIKGTEMTIVTNITQEFFDGVDSLTSGMALGIVTLESATGGLSEVGFRSDFIFTSSNFTTFESESFEDGTFPISSWSTGGDGAWAISTEKSYDGIASLRSPDLEGGLPEKAISNATLHLHYNFPGGMLRFNIIASVRPPYDIFTVYIDGEQAAQLVDMNEWTEVLLGLEPGPHEIDFSYQYSIFGLHSLPPSPPTREGAVWVDAVEVLVE